MKERELMKSKWIDAQKEKPPISDMWKESEYLYCRESKSSVPFVGYYMGSKNEWRVAHHFAGNQPVKVSHWKALPQ